MTAPYDPAPMAALIDRAEREQKWLFASYHQLWFSPAELRAENAKGRFCWGPVNWQLRDPLELHTELEKAVENARRALHALEVRMCR